MATARSTPYTIGQLAKATGIKAVTIRYYERLELLPEAELERLSACCEGGVIDDCRIIESLSVRRR